jgi:hypothetical protein
MGERDINDVHRNEGLDAARAFHDSARPFNGAGDDDALGEASIPPDTMRCIRDGVDQPARSDVFWNCCLVLHRLAFTIDGAVALLEKYPNGIAAKYRGRLRNQVETIFRKLGPLGTAQERIRRPPGDFEDPFETMFDDGKEGDLVDDFADRLDE